MVARSVFIRCICFLSAVFLISGCYTLSFLRQKAFPSIEPSVMPNKKENDNGLRLLPKSGLRIAILADSQITSIKGLVEADRIFRTKTADRKVASSLRPAALEYLSDKILKYYLKQITTHKVDVILYLGDFANSGCTDEVEKALAIFKEPKDSLKIPIFVVLGNHDYLGLGNTHSTNARNRYCRNQDFINFLHGTKPRTINTIDDLTNANRSRRLMTEKDLDSFISNNELIHFEKKNFQDKTIKALEKENLPLTKVSLIEKLKKFNQDSSQLIRTSHQGNIDSLSYQDNLDNLKEFEKKCDITNPEYQHKKLGCYYSAKINLTNSSKKFQLLLVDTSDYPDRYVYDFAGVIGNISYGNNSQLTWLEKQMNHDQPVTRLIASHYDLNSIWCNELDDLVYNDKEFKNKCLPAPSLQDIDYCDNLLIKQKNRCLGSPKPFAIERLLTTKDKVPNRYWLSAHTHTSEIKLNKSANEINVGSTTDYLAHFAILDFSKDTGALDKVYQIGPLWDKNWCEARYKEIVNPESYHLSKKVLRNEPWGPIHLGLTTDYRNGNWHRAQYITAIDNIEEYIEQIKKSGCAGYSSDCENWIEPFLGKVAGLYEKNNIKTGKKLPTSDEICN